MLLKSLKLSNFLSFGESTQVLELRPLNVVIGPNGSGKSNLIESVDLIRSTPSTSEKSNLLAAIRDGGGVRDWLWKGSAKTPHAAIDAVFANPKGPVDLRYARRRAAPSRRSWWTRRRSSPSPTPGRAS